MGLGIFLIIIGVFIFSFGIHCWDVAEGFGDMFVGAICCCIIGLCITITGISLCCDEANPDSGDITCTEYSVDRTKTETVSGSGDTVVTMKYTIHYKK